MMLRKSLDTRTTQVAASLVDEYSGAIQSLAESDWQNIYTLTKDSNYYLIPSGATYTISSGTTTTIKEGQTFTRYFTVQNVNRDSCGLGNITSTAGTSCTVSSWPPSSSLYDEDPSTQKITVVVSWGNDHSINSIKYLTRSQNKVFVQTDWSGGSGQENFPTSTSGSIVNNSFSTSTNIDFTTSTGSLYASSTASLGSATSSIFDTQIASATINSILWQGDKPAGAAVYFQFFSGATTTNMTFIGPDGTVNSYYPNNSTGAATSSQVWLNPAYNSNKRYFRYKIFVSSTPGASPRVDDVIVNWSP